MVQTSTEITSKSSAPYVSYRVQQVAFACITALAAIAAITTTLMIYGILPFPVNTIPLSDQALYAVASGSAAVCLLALYAFYRACSSPSKKSSSVSNDSRNAPQPVATDEGNHPGSTLGSVVATENPFPFSTAEIVHEETANPVPLKKIDSPLSQEVAAPAYASPISSTDSIGASAPSVSMKPRDIESELSCLSSNIIANGYYCKVNYLDTFVLIYCNNKNQKSKIKKFDFDFQREQFIETIENRCDVSFYQHGVSDAFIEALPSEFHQVLNLAFKQITLKSFAKFHSNNKEYYGIIYKTDIGPSYEIYKNKIARDLLAQLLTQDLFSDKTSTKIQSLFTPVFPGEDEDTFNQKIEKLKRQINQNYVFCNIDRPNQFITIYWDCDRQIALSKCFISDTERMNWLYLGKELLKGMTFYKGPLSEIDRDLVKDEISKQLGGDDFYALFNEYGAFLPDNSIFCYTHPDHKWHALIARNSEGVQDYAFKDEMARDIHIQNLIKINGRLSDRFREPTYEDLVSFRGSLFRTDLSYMQYEISDQLIRDDFYGMFKESASLLPQNSFFCYTHPDHKWYALMIKTDDCIQTFAYRREKAREDHIHNLKGVTDWTCVWLREPTYFEELSLFLVPKSDASLGIVKEHLFEHDFIFQKNPDTDSRLEGILAVYRKTNLDRIQKYLVFKGDYFICNLDLNRYALYFNGDELSPRIFISKEERQAYINEKLKPLIDPESQHSPDCSFFYDLISSKKLNEFKENQLFSFCKESFSIGDPECYLCFNFPKKNIFGTIYKLHNGAVELSFFCNRESRNLHLKYLETGFDIKNGADKWRTFPYSPREVHEYLIPQSGTFPKNFERQIPPARTFFYREIFDSETKTPLGWLLAITGDECEYTIGKRVLFSPHVEYEGCKTHEKLEESKKELLALKDSSGRRIYHDGHRPFKKIPILMDASQALRKSLTISLRGQEKVFAILPITAPDGFSFAILALKHANNIGPEILYFSHMLGCKGYLENQPKYKKYTRFDDSKFVQKFIGKDFDYQESSKQATS